MPNAHRTVNPAPLLPFHTKTPLHTHIHTHIRTPHVYRPTLHPLTLAMNNQPENNTMDTSGHAPSVSMWSRSKMPYRDCHSVKMERPKFLSRGRERAEVNTSLEDGDGCKEPNTKPGVLLGLVVLAMLTRSLTKQRNNGALSGLCSASYAHTAQQQCQKPSRTTALPAVAKT